ncbi:MAG: FAD binding domain-containing protein [Nakamurella sp.]
MDLTTVTEVLVARGRADLADPRPGDAYLAGGTALYGDTDDSLRRLIDLTELDWTPLVVRSDGLHIAATCTVAELRAFQPPTEWPHLADLVAACCDAFLASFKIWNRSTVGGNLCVSYPAGSMISLAAAADGRVLVWRPDGSEYWLPVTDFVIGDTVNVLQPGEVLREILLPDAAVRERYAVRTLALAPLGRSSAVIIARPRGHSLALTISASTQRPYAMRVPRGRVADLIERIDAVVRGNWVDDVYGAAAWRRHITGVLAAEVIAELA